MLLVTCTTCGVVFDLEVAKTCEGHMVKDKSGNTIPFYREHCFLCPLGHAGHSSRRWKKAQRRPPTPREKGLGITFMLSEFEVKIGGPSDVRKR